MQNLILGIVPVVLFWIFEEKMGTAAGVIAALVWCIGELSWEWIKFRRFQKITLFSGILIVVFGGLDIIFSQTRFFLFQPVVVEAVVIVLFYKSLLGDEPKILEWMGTRAPALSEDAQVRNLQIRSLKKMGMKMVVLMTVHLVLLAVAAAYFSTSVWAFVKGPGFLLLALLFVGIELARIKLFNKSNF